MKEIVIKKDLASGDWIAVASDGVGEFEITNRKTVRVFADDSAKEDFAFAGITPKQILRKAALIFREDNFLDFNYDFSRFTVEHWHHKEPPRQFWGNSYQCPLHSFLYRKAETKIRLGKYNVIFVFSGNLWVGSGISYLGHDGNGIIIIGTKNEIITPFDWLMNRVCFKYFIKKLFNRFRFFILHPSFLWKSEKDRYLLALAATCVHEQAHAFGIQHSDSYSVMSYANMWYWRFDALAQSRLLKILQSEKTAHA